MPGLTHYLILSAVLFCIGLFGALARRNAVVILMAIEMMFNAVNIALVAFNRFAWPKDAAGQTLVTGQLFAIFVMTVAAAEVAVGLAIVITLYRSRATIDVQKTDTLKG